MQRPGNFKDSGLLWCALSRSLKDECSDASQKDVLTGHVGFLGRLTWSAGASRLPLTCFHLVLYEKQA